MGVGPCVLFLPDLGGPADSQHGGSSSAASLLIRVLAPDDVGHRNGANRTPIPIQIGRRDGANRTRLRDGPTTVRHSVGIGVRNESERVSDLSRSHCPTSIGTGVRSPSEYAGNHRALVYDPKRESIPLVYGMARAAEISILNPFDSRTLAWDLAADVTAPNEANAVASVLIPEDEGASQRYFSDAARSLVASVMTAFALGVKSRDWTLRDVILALRDPNRLKAVVALHRATEDKAQPYLADSRVLPSVLSTVATKMDQFDVVAAFWARATAAGRKFSIRRWLGGRGVVVLGASPANRANVDPINRAFFKRLSDILLEQQDKAESYTWVLLDELREAGYLYGLRSLMSQGRSKGVCVALGFQDIEGLECAYPDGEAGEILGQCSHGAFLRTNSHKSAEWVQSHFAESEFHETEYTEGSSTGREGTTSSVSTTVKRARYTDVLAAEVLGLPRTSVANGLSRFFDLPDHPVFRACLRFHDLGLLAPSGYPSRQPHLTDEGFVG